MKHLHHFNFNSQELLQCPHCNQYLPKSNHDFGPNYQEPVNRCYCHCACCQHRNDKQNNQEQAQNRPLLSVNYHKSHLLVERIKTGIESLMYSLLYAFVLFLFFCLCLSFISCGNDKTASDYQKSAL
jgi:hypothetical protein